MHETIKTTRAGRPTAQAPLFQLGHGEPETAFGKPWPIPHTWTWTVTGEIAQIVGGGTPRTTEPANFHGNIPWITPADLSGYTSKLISRGARSITKRALDSSGARMMPAGTVLFSSRAPIGYVAIAANPVSTNQGFKSFVLSDGIAPDYLYFYLQRARELAVALASGTTFLEISGQKAALIPVPVAPLPEQHRIVAEIEKQFTRLEAAVEALKRVRTNLKRYRASVLKAACEGRLVPTEAELARAENRSYEPADKLLARILKERRARWEANQLAKMRAAGKPPRDDKWKAKCKEPAAPDTSNPPQLPEGWVWVAVEQVSSLVQYGSSAKTQENISGVPVLRMGNIKANGGLDLNDLKYLSADHSEFPKLLLQVGDLLFNRTNSPELVGKSAVYHGTPAPCSFASYLIRVQTLDECIPDYITYCLNSTLGRTWTRSVVSQQVGQANVNGTKLQAFQFPLPPFAEQQRIVAEVERRLSVIDELEATVEANLKRAAGLRQAILKRAFEGKLVPQDPNDEPAGILLERIKNDRRAKLQ